MLLKDVVHKGTEQNGALIVKERFISMEISLPISCHLKRIWLIGMVIWFCRQPTFLCRIQRGVDGQVGGRLRGGGRRERGGSSEKVDQLWDSEKCSEWHNMAARAILAPFVTVSCPEWLRARNWQLYSGWRYLLAILRNSNHPNHHRRALISMSLDHKRSLHRLDFVCVQIWGCNFYLKFTIKVYSLLKGAGVAQ